MAAPDRAEILRRARDAFREHGRGFAVVIEGRDEPRYGFLDELRENLVEEPEADTLVEATQFALKVCVPEAAFKLAAADDEARESYYLYGTVLRKPCLPGTRLY